MNSPYCLCTRTERLLGKWKWTVVGSGITCILHPTAANAWVIKFKFPCPHLNTKCEELITTNNSTMPNWKISQNFVKFKQAEKEKKNKKIYHNSS